MRFIQFFPSSKVDLLFTVSHTQSLTNQLWHHPSRGGYVCYSGFLVSTSKTLSSNARCTAARHILCVEPQLLQQPIPMFPYSEILRMAYWSTPSTFQRFYFKLVCSRSSSMSLFFCCMFILGCSLSLQMFRYVNNLILPTFVLFIYNLL